MTTGQVTLLKDVPIGTRVRIRQLHSAPETCNRLREMGLCEDAVIRCLMKGDRSIICEVCNARVGLSGGLASEIVVTAC